MNKLWTQLQEHMSVSGVMRLIGVLVVVAGMCSFLLEEWHSWNDTGRYFVMFGGSCLFALAGLLMSYAMRDNVSARVFLGLGLASVVANFTTLGGLVHSLYQPAAGMDLGAGSVLLAMACAYTVLLPIAWFAFKVLAGTSARLLTFAFAGMNSLLLLPMRDSLSVGLLTAVAVAVPLWLSRTSLRDRLALKTIEGRVSMLALGAPAAIIVARALWLYQADALLAWMFSGIALLAVQHINTLVRRAEDADGFNALQLPSLVLSFALVVVNSIAGWLLVQPLLPVDAAGPLALPLLGGIAGVLVYALSRGYQSTVLLNLAGVVLCLSQGVNLLFHSGWMVVAAAAAAGAVTLAAGHRNGQPVLRGCGWLTLGVSLLPELLAVVGRVDFTHWIPLTCIGVLVIVGASLWDKGWLRQPAADVDMELSEPLQDHDRNAAG